MSRSFDVSILDQRLTVRSDGDEESVQRIAEDVGKRIVGVMDKSKTASVLTASLLTCMNLAGYAVRQAAVAKEANEKVARKIRDLIGLTAL